MVEMVERLSVAQIVDLLSAARGKTLDRLLGEFAQDERAGVKAACRAAVAASTRRRKERARTAQMYRTEHALREEGWLVIAGVDEVGRGALAGPLTVAAVVLPGSPHIEGLDDSKRLSPSRREELALEVRSLALAVGVAHVSAGELDALGVTGALRRAIALAISGLTTVPDHVVLDGLPLHVVENETAIVKADAKVAAVAAASIVAKVARDALMRSFAVDHPEYGFEINKGYGTTGHLAAILRHGPCPLHRRSFSWGANTQTLF
jgi:ribonuclease HII